jgi:diaminopimelate epimerase
MQLEDCGHMTGDAATGIYEKWHGAGNDFLVVIRPRGAAPLDGDVARRWCDRHTGFGADGLVEGTFGDRGLTMHLFNADGGRAELSGNGLRCLVAAAAAHGLVPEGVVEVATDAGRKRVTIALDPSGGRAWGAADMGDVVLGAGDSLEGGVSASTGNPHLVVADPGLPDEALAGLAASLTEGIESGANVEFVTVVGDDHLAIRVVERGVGLTLACGTGSCAAAAVAHHLGLVGERVTVTNPGGDLVVTLAGASADLAGPAQRIGAFEAAGL